MVDKSNKTTYVRANRYSTREIRQRPACQSTWHDVSADQLLDLCIFEPSSIHLSRASVSFRKYHSLQYCIGYGSHSKMFRTSFQSSFPSSILDHDQTTNQIRTYMGWALMGRTKISSQNLLPTISILVSLFLLHLLLLLHPTSYVERRRKTRLLLPSSIYLRWLRAITLPFL